MRNIFLILTLALFAGCSTASSNHKSARAKGLYLEYFGQQGIHGIVGPIVGPGVPPMLLYHFHDSLSYTKIEVVKMREDDSAVEVDFQYNVSFDGLATDPSQNLTFSKFHTTKYKLFFGVEVTGTYEQ